MKDVLCGGGGGKIWLLINNNTNADPVFNTKVYLKNGKFGLDLIVNGGDCRPVVFDFDLDGKRDLVVGEEFGGRRTPCRAFCEYFF